jgi:hypothetical protein
MKVVVLKGNSRYFIATNVSLKSARETKKTLIDNATEFIVVRITV